MTATERPIIFSGEMVRAILDGRKTMTRRVVKPQPDESVWKPWVVPEARAYLQTDERGKVLSTHGLYHQSRHSSELALVRWRCPYGQPGDRLWVKENIRCTSIWHEVPAGQPMSGRDVAHAVYDADEQQAPLDAWPWERYMLSSLFCPRGLSRITLEITGIRVERVQEISRSDCMSEGCPIKQPDGRAANTDPKRWFRQLWDSLNAKRGYGWGTNCWVWVIEFRVI